jgi:oligopeptide/dipeptide ABC transporter ATP-binding protein
MSVLYAGRVVEEGPVADVLARPAHPYTAALLRAVPRLEGGSVEDLAVIPGRVPPPREWSRGGCVFAPRCGRARPECSATDPAPRAVGPGHAAACPACGRG